MAQFEQKPNTGSIFKNDTKGNEKAPAYKGKVNIEGKIYEVALWVKESSKGDKFFAAKFQEPQSKKTFIKDESNDLPF